MIKADGLAAGKGVVVAMSKDEAFAAIDMMLSDNKLGDAGARVVIEEFLAGEEASFIVMVDGKNVLAMATSQDHKRLLDGDNGPNTGGMGAYSPAPVVTPQLHARVLREVIQPVVRGMEQEGITYTGFLYAGLMIDAQGNAQGAGIQLPHGRPGNPAHHAAPEKRFRGHRRARHQRHAGPGGSGMGQAHRARRGAGRRQLSRHAAQGRCHHRPAAHRQRLEDAHVFHAGTAMQDGKVVTNGGRVLCVTALGTMVKMAQKRAYEIADGIHFDGCQMRRDIGYRAIGANRK